MSKHAEREYPIILRHARKMFEFAETVMGNGFKLEVSDHYGFMALCFGYKQLNHARSIGILVDSDQYADATVLARIMLEGCVLLGWASMSPTDRGLRWRAYALISDWKLLQSQKADGQVIDPEIEETLKSRLADLGDPYLTSRARRNPEGTFDDPYQNTWMVNDDGEKVQLSDMIAELNDPGLKLLYASLSQYSHWTPRGVGELMTRTDEGVRIGFEQKNMAAQSCAVAIQMLGHTIELLSLHFKLGLEGKVKEMFKQYFSEMNSGT